MTRLWCKYQFQKRAGGPEYCKIKRAGPTDRCFFACHDGKGGMVECPNFDGDYVYMEDESCQKQ